MKRLIYVLIPLIILSISLTVSASIYGDAASGNDLIDQRTFNTASSYSPSSSEGGLEGYWPYSFGISWNISQDITSNLWTYEYTLNATRKEVSHFIIEVSDSTSQSDFSNLSANGTPLTFGSNLEGPDFFGNKPGNSDPDYPSSTNMYGIKFDTGGLPATYQLTTNRSPVWGNFYAKGGKDSGQFVRAYNSALAIGNFNSDGKIDFVVRPNGTPIVPEPVSSVLFLSGSAALGFRSFLKRKKK